MKPQWLFRCFRSGADPHLAKGGSNDKYLIFSGNDNYFIENGKVLLEERISIFDRMTNPIRCFSIDDLNSMNVNDLPIYQEGHRRCYTGVWDDKSVLVKIVCECRDSKELRELVCREIAVATQMGTHTNAHRLLGFCLVTSYPVLVYESAENGTLEDRIFEFKDQGKQALDWLDRLRLAWEIAHAVSYLHTAFRRPIIHRSLHIRSVFLDQDDSARLSDFSAVISIPEGKKHVEDVVRGTVAYAAPEYIVYGRLAQSADVFSFGALLLALVSGKPSFTRSPYHGFGWDELVDLVNDNRIADIIDPAIPTNGSLSDEHFQSHLKAFIELALRCIDHDEERRPTMVEVATELNSIFMSSSASL